MCSLLLVSGAGLVAVALAAGSGVAAVASPPLPVPGAGGTPLLPRRGTGTPSPTFARAGPAAQTQKSSIYSNKQ